MFNLAELDTIADNAMLKANAILEQLGLNEENKETIILSPQELWQSLLDKGFFVSNWADEYMQFKPSSDHWQFFDWVLASQKKVSLFLGTREIGKTQMLTIFYAVWLVYSDRQKKIVIASATMSRAIKLSETIIAMLVALGVSMQNDTKTRCKTIENKSELDSVSPLSIGASMRGLHVDLIIFDDPIEEKDKNKQITLDNALNAVNEGLKIAKKVHIVGQYVREGDLYTIYEKSKEVDVFKAKYSIYEHLVREKKEALLQLITLRSFGLNYELEFYEDTECIFSGIKTTSNLPTSKLVAVIDPALVTDSVDENSHDYTSLCIGGYNIDNVIALTVIKWKLAWYDCIHEIAQILIYFNVDYIYYEGQGNKLIAEMLKNHYGLNAMFITPKGDKLQNIQSLKPYISFNSLMLTDLTTEETTRSIKMFNAHSKHDDDVDSMQMCVKKIKQVIG